MWTMLAEMPPLRTALLGAAPLAYLLAALVAWAPGTSVATAWRVGRIASALALVAAGLSAAWLLNDGAALRAGLRSDALSLTMLLLIGFIGWVIVGYSQTCLQGERGQQRYVRCLMATLAAVSLLVTSNHLLVLVTAWIATSLALHGLLTFFDQRPQALIVAHKKFIASRVADVCMLSAVALVYGSLGTLHIDQAIAGLKALPAVPAPLQAAALLFVLAALLKCAMLPVHGWLIQVMEAPTPVSALLHAGVVNLGGVLLIRLGPLVSETPAAMALLVVVGSLTAAIAALVMSTRISIKVSLAWSTCAQMGFMLMQCGLGLHALALLHLVAHSLYKAYAFLSAGTAVETNRLRQMTPAAPPPTLGRWFAAAAAGMAITAAAALAFNLRPAEAPALWAVAWVLALALAPLLATRGDARSRLAAAGAAAVVALACFGWHLLFERWLGLAPVAVPPPAVAWVVGLFALLFVVQGWLRAKPQGALACALYPWLFAGLYLDELFTRLTFRLWPARLLQTANRAAGDPSWT
jgi:NAD(P)H-quinone oxidoreductase subunit 5